MWGVAEFGHTMYMYHYSASRWVFIIYKLKLRRLLLMKQQSADCIAILIMFDNISCAMVAKKSIKNTWIQACPMGNKQLSHFACLRPLARLSYWFCYRMTKPGPLTSQKICLSRAKLNGTFFGPCNKCDAHSEFLFCLLNLLRYIFLFLSSLWLLELASSVTTQNNSWYATISLRKQMIRWKTVNRNNIRKYP